MGAIFSLYLKFCHIVFQKVVPNSFITMHMAYFQRKPSCFLLTSCRKCKVNLADQTPPACVLGCGHVYHTHCARKFGYQSAKCPKCFKLGLLPSSQPRKFMNLPSDAPEDTRQCVSCTRRIFTPLPPACKLPCGHLFHFGCVRLDLKDKQACPECSESAPINPERMKVGYVPRFNKFKPKLGYIPESPMEALASIGMISTKSQRNCYNDYNNNGKSSIMPSVNVLSHLFDY
uniref:RING-type domain-containing protein n=1 Tax=Panagrellus redivivus TaxID=6233 RepID=A0A7E4V4W2_PANRE